MEDSTVEADDCLKHVDGCKTSIEVDQQRLGRLRGRQDVLQVTHSGHGGVATVVGTLGIKDFLT